MLFFFLPVLLGVILVIIRCSIWRGNYCKNLPGIKPGFFNIPGDMTKIFMSYVSKSGLPLLEDLKRYMKEWTEQFQQQQLFYVWAFYHPFICIVKAEAVKQLLCKETGKHYDVMKPLLGTGLLTSSVKKWKPRRKLLTPCFHADILREFLTVFNERSRYLVEHLRQETTKEFTYIGPPLTLTALDTIYESIIGTTVGALENNKSQYANALQRLLAIYMARTFKFWEWSDIIYGMTSGRKAKRDEKFIHDFVQSVIEEKKKQYVIGNGKGNSNRKRKAFIDLLLELHFETQELNEQDIREEIITFVMAGFETVSLTLTWALFLIGLHPDVQAKIHEELDKIFGSDVDGHITENDLNDLQYLHCVLKETQRLYSTAPLVSRVLKEDSNICGYTIPKGTTCAVLIYFLHRDKEVFPDPEKFDPDRFLPENASKIPEYGFIPFSGGPRNCIGQRFAVMEMKTIIASILRNYTVESLDSRDKVLPVIQITLHPSVPVRMRIRPRLNIKCDETTRLK